MFRVWRAGFNVIRHVLFSHSDMTVEAIIDGLNIIDVSEQVVVTRCSYAVVTEAYAGVFRRALLRVIVREHEVSSP